MLTFGGRGTSTQVLLSMRDLYSSHIACFQLGSPWAWKGDFGIGEEVVGGGGGGRVIGGVGVVCDDGVDSRVGGEVQWGRCRDYHLGIGMREFSWSYGAEGKDNFVKYYMTRNDDFVSVQVKAPISAMIVRVPEKDRWCGTRGKFVRWKGVTITKASKRAKVEDELERGDNVLLSGISEEIAIAKDAVG
ncbi:hypothetical protein Tco_0150939 [Tanacetum coccineum]